MRKQLAVFFAAALGLSLGASLALACSQCICGSPLPAAYLWGPEPDRCRFGLEERYHSKSNALEDVAGREEESEHRVSGFGMWRPVEPVLLIARMPYTFREMIETPVGEERTRQTNSGFSDLELGVTWRVAQPKMGESRRAVISLLGGLNPPTGSNSATDETGERLEEHLQTGTGAWRGTVGGTAVCPLGSGTFEVDAEQRWNGTNDYEYHYGNAFLSNAGYSSRLYGRWQFLAFANGRAGEADEDGAEIVPHTGGTMIFAAPAVRYWSTSHWIADLSFQIPVVSNLFGDQTENTVARLGISFAP